MKKLVLSIVSAGFLACLGIEALHSHDRTAPPDCALCLVKDQAQAKQSPQAAPAVVRLLAASPLPAAPASPASSVCAAEPSARAPPRA